MISITQVVKCCIWKIYYLQNNKVGLLLSPNWDMGQGRTPIEEVENNDSHDDRHTSYCHHRGQVDA